MFMLLKSLGTGMRVVQNAQESLCLQRQGNMGMWGSAFPTTFTKHSTEHDGFAALSGHPELGSATNQLDGVPAIGPGNQIIGNPHEAPLPSAPLVGLVSFPAVDGLIVHCQGVFQGAHVT